jgi:hypothetical protein
LIPSKALYLPLWVSLPGNIAVLIILPGKLKGCESKIFLPLTATIIS